MSMAPQIVAGTRRVEPSFSSAAQALSGHSNTERGFPGEKCVAEPSRRQRSLANLSRASQTQA
eukprot:7863585-Pyramimonas_sp.AAC.1